MWTKYVPDKRQYFRNRFNTLLFLTTVRRSMFKDFVQRYVMRTPQRLEILNGKGNGTVYYKNVNFPLKLVVIPKQFKSKRILKNIKCNLRAASNGLEDY